MTPNHDPIQPPTRCRVLVWREMLSTMRNPLDVAGVCSLGRCREAEGSCRRDMAEKMQEVLGNSKKLQGS